MSNDDLTSHHGTSNIANCVVIVWTHNNETDEWTPHPFEEPWQAVGAIEEGGHPFGEAKIITAAPLTLSINFPEPDDA